MPTSSKENKLKVLTEKKETLFLRIQTLFDLSKKKDATSLKNFQIMYTRLDQTELQLEQLIDEINILQLEIDSEYQPNFKVLDAVNEMCCHIRSTYNEIMQPQNMGQSSRQMNKLQNRLNYQSWNYLVLIQIKEFIYGLFFMKLLKT